MGREGGRSPAWRPIPGIQSSWGRHQPVCWASLCLQPLAYLATQCCYKACRRMLGASVAQIDVMHSAARVLCAERNVMLHVMPMFAAGSTRQKAGKLRSGVLWLMEAADGTDDVYDTEYQARERGGAHWMVGGGCLAIRCCPAGSGTCPPFPTPPCLQACGPPTLPHCCCMTHYIRLDDGKLNTSEPRPARAALLPPR